MEILKQVAIHLAGALLTEKFMKKLIVFTLKKLAEKSDNKVDDELVRMIEEALEKKD